MLLYVYMNGLSRKNCNVRQISIIKRAGGRTTCGSDLGVVVSSIDSTQALPRSKAISVLISPEPNVTLAPKKLQR